MDILKLCSDITHAIGPTNLFTPVIDVKNGVIHICGNQYPLHSIKKIKVVGIGKASALQTAALLSHLKKFPELKKKIEKGLCLTKYDHSVQMEDLVCLEAGHPLPDQNSIEGTKRVIEYIADMKECDLLITCISGGTSSLLTYPIPEFDIKDLSSISLELLGSGATIEEINAIRKEISIVKNGGLLNFSGTSNVEVLLVSDVSSNEIGMIGSGPFYFSETPKKELKRLIDTYLSKKWQDRIERWIDADDRDQFLNEKKKRRAHHTIISDFASLMQHSRSKLELLGYKADVINDPVTTGIGEGIEIHLDLLKKLCNDSKRALISGGEIPIHVHGNGLGGRNTEFVVQMAKALFEENELKLSQNDLGRITIVSIGTDGTDGPTEYAGGFFKYSHLKKINELGIDINETLANNDTLNLLTKIGSAIKTGPTGTNLMDLRIITID